MVVASEFWMLALTRPAMMTQMLSNTHILESVTSFLECSGAQAF